MKICIYASDLAIITGHNHYQDKNELYLKMWKKHYPIDFQKIFLETSQTIEINEISQEELKLSEKINNALDSKNVSELKDKKEILMKEIKDSVNKDILKQHINSTLNKNFGIKHENSAISAYTKKTNDTVSIIEKFMKKSLYRTKNHVWYLGGRIDGITENNTIIEIKNRVNNLFYTLREYEKIQAYAYMYIMETNKAKLVESLQNNKININILDIVYEDHYWNTIIDPKIKKFIKDFEKFMKDINRKKQLIGILFGTHS